ncbi:MAG: glycosyltransferase family 2 protein [Pyrinomonadaceae bacterium]|nr:glycosyltransferase family 2 protein [Pyrinomonadaceae bacterium]MDQ3134302.1 glycosyltransferase family 2 protein [Acidobacteriota bacterium]
MVDHLNRSQPVLAVVVPCFDEALVIEETARRLLVVLDELMARHVIAPSSFVYFVDDGSADQTWELIKELHRNGGGGRAVKGLKLARNVGHQNALLAGLLNVKDRADCVISMDADLQHDERALPAFVEKYQAGADIVFGVRADRRTDSRYKKATALFFYKLMRLMGVKLIANHADYRLSSRKALDALAAYGEVNLFLRGIFLDIGLKSETVTFEVRQRHAGRSKYSSRRMLSFALDGITSFSVTPLRFVTLTGVLVFVLSFVLACYVLFTALWGNVVPGWASTVLPIYFLGGLQIMMTGLVGEYLGKIYQEIKARPRYIKDEELF